MALINRTRSTETRAKGWLKQRAYYSKSGVTQTTYSSTTSYATGLAKQINDVVHAQVPFTKGSRRRQAVRFKKRNPQRIVLNPMSVVSVEHDNRDGLIVIPGDGQYAAQLTLSGNLTGLYGAPSTPFSSLGFKPFLAKYSNYLLNKVAAKSQEPQHDFGVTLGELGESVKMLVNPISSLVKFSSKYLPKGLKFIRQRIPAYHRDAAYTHVNVHGTWVPRECYVDFSQCDMRSKKLRRMLEGCRNVRLGSTVGKGRVHHYGIATINEASNYWLAFRFGIQPMVGEIDSIASMYEDGAKTLSSITRHRARVLVSKTESTSCEWATCFGSQLLYRTVQKHEEFYSATLYCGRKYENSIGNALRNIGLHPLQIPGILWELVPLSFVVDRFIDIGGFLTANTPNQSVVRLGNAVGHKVVDTYHVNVIDARNKTYPKLKGPCAKSGSYTVTRQEYTRLVDLPIPNYPVWNPKLLDISQVIDHLTLLWQKMPKLR